MIKIYRLLLMLIIFFCSINTVVASNSDFIINSVNIDDKSEYLDRSNLTYDKLNISDFVIFNEVGEYVKYKINLKNNSNKEYKIKNITDNYLDSYINITYNYDDGFIMPNDDFIIYVTFKYDNSPDLTKKEILNNILISIILEDLNYNEVNVLVNINPNTYDNIKVFIISLISTFLALIVIIKRIKKIYIIPLILIGCMTTYVYALQDDILCIQFNNIIVNNNPNRFKNFINEEIGITRDKISNIYFVNEDELPNDLDGSYDISVFNDNSIITFYRMNSDMFDLYIVSNEEISRYYSNNMANLFSNLENVHTIDLSNFDLSKVSNMEYMFYNDINLEEIIWSEYVNTSRVSSLESMFSNCVKLKTVDLSNFDTSNVTSMKWMFGISSELKSYGELEYVDVSGFDTSNVVDMSSMFQNQSHLNNLDVSNFNTSNVNSMYYMFHNCKNLEFLDVSGFDTSKVTTMKSMFGSCNKLNELDVSGFDTSKVTNMSAMFSNCWNVKVLDVSNFDTSNVTDMKSMFYNCTELQAIDVSNFDTSNVTDMSWMFGVGSTQYNNGYHPKIKIIDVSGFDTSKVTNMTGMFQYQELITELDVSGFNTSNVEDMSYMFGFCSNVKRLDVSGFDTSKVTTMKSMFNNCSSLTEIDVSNFNTNNVTDMSYMFNYCTNLTELDVSSFNTSNVTNMAVMFQRCQNLKYLDVSNFDTSNVKEMGYMFGSCYNLETLDLGNFSTKNATAIYNMFRLCQSLKTIYVDNDFEIVEGANSKYMFLDAKKIVGGNGTTYNGSYTNAAYARIDREGIPGYFTKR